VLELLFGKKKFYSMFKMKILVGFCSILIFAACSKDSGGDPAPANLPSIRINDVQQLRDAFLPTTFHFVVSLDKVSSKEVKVDYTTLDGNTNGDEYTKKTGTLTIPANSQNAAIDVIVKPDSLREENKIFYVQLSNPVNAKIGSGKGTGTIFCLGTYLAVDNAGFSTPENYPGYTLKWADEFNGSVLDKNSWNYETGASGWGNNELENYTSSANNSFITNHKYLVIEARKEGTGYTSARIQTLGKHEMTYGRVDIRAKLPKGKGVWPALWMLGSNIATTPWPASGEIDIMELLGHEPNKVYGTMHWGNVGEGSQNIGGNYILNGEDFSQKFHVFSVVRDSAKIEWYVDDHKFFTGTKEQTNGNFPFDKPFFFIFNVAVGGNWPGNPDGTTVFPQRMIVDYIRVFE
jgi:beta-glucanase (GH16 family)